MRKLVLASLMLALSGAAAASGNLSVSVTVVKPVCFAIEKQGKQEMCDPVAIRPEARPTPAIDPASIPAATGLYIRLK